MRTSCLLLVVLALVNFSPAVSSRRVGAQTIQSAAATTQLTVHRGIDYSYTPADGNFFASASDRTGDGIADYVTITFFGNSPGVFWFLDFGTNGLGRNMGIGHYAKAERAAFATSGHPGLDVSGLGAGCNTVRGQFTVLDAQFDYSVSPIRVVSFAAEFEQHCEGGPRADTGKIYFNYAPTTTLSINPASVGGGQSAVGTVSLVEPAPFGGAHITLTSGDTTVATVASGTDIPQGQTTATFPVLTKIVKSPPSVVILATYGGVASAATLGVVSPIPSITQLVMHSEPGDFVGGGRDYLIQKSDGDFMMRPHGLTAGQVDGVSLFFIGQTSFWLVDFNVSRLGIPLRPGVYEGGQRYPFQEPGHPGLDIAGDGRGCNMLTGKFTIIEATFDYSFSPPDVLTFAAQFEQHCEGGPAALTGTLYYNFTPGPVFDACLQDDSSGALFQMDTATGAYQFSNCAGVNIAGTGSITRRGSLVTLQHFGGDRRVIATVDLGNRRGNASIQSLALGRSFSVLDRNTANNTCSCAQP